MFWFSRQLLFQIFLILTRIQRHIDINVKSLHTKYTLCFSDINETLIFSTSFGERNSNIKCHQNLSKRNWILPCGQIDGRTDGWRDRHDKANSRLPQILWTSLKREMIFCNSGDALFQVNRITETTNSFFKITNTELTSSYSLLAST